jgi:hypothetical protein
MYKLFGRIINYFYIKFMSFLKKILGLDKKDCKCGSSEKCGCEKKSCCSKEEKPASAQAQSTGAQEGNPQM